jgi:hypothetical protein
MVERRTSIRIDKESEWHRTFMRILLAMTLMQIRDVDLHDVQWIKSEVVIVQERKRDQAKERNEGESR